MDGELIGSTEFRELKTLSPIALGLGDAPYLLKDAPEVVFGSNISNYSIQLSANDSVRFENGLYRTQNWTVIESLVKVINDPKTRPHELHIVSGIKIFKNTAEMVEYVFAAGKKGLGIQRYKGLGEMNPEQLWETTMMPEKRLLLQVKVDDAYTADEIFSTLMGEDVEPRKLFLQGHAMEVRNLDI